MISRCSVEILQTGQVCESPTLCCYNCLQKVTNQDEIIKLGEAECWLINKRKIYWIMVLSEAGGQTIRY